MKLLALLSLLALAFTSVACGDDSKPAVDAGADVAGDAGGDSASDVTDDAGHEVGADSSGDASVG